MSILQDMADKWARETPIPKGAEWHIGVDVWGAFQADLARQERDGGVTDFKGDERELLGLPVVRDLTISHWELRLTPSSDGFGEFTEAMLQLIEHLAAVAFARRTSAP